MPVKVKVHGLKGVTANIKKRINSVEKNNALLRDIGKIITKDIKASIRAGKDPATGKNFPKLKASTIAARKRYKGPKGRAFKAEFANITRTGKLVRSIRATIKSNVITISVADKSRKEIAGYLADLGFNIFGLPKETKKEIIKSLKSLLKKIL